MSLVNHGACPFDRTDPPSALVVGLSPNQDEMSGQTKIGFMQLQLEGSLYKTLILKFYGNAQGGRPRPPKSKVKLFNIVQKQLTNTPCL